MGHAAQLYISNRINHLAANRRFWGLDKKNPKSALTNIRPLKQILPLGVELALDWLESAMKLSVVIPVYNERRTLRQLVQRVAEAPFETEILCVDDGSTDGSGNSSPNFKPNTHN